MDVVKGQLVRAKAGRDAPGTLAVLAVEGEYLLLADGKLRTMDHLKKKRRKHLKTTGIVVEELKARLREGAAVENHEIRSWLKREDM